MGQVQSLKNVCNLVVDSNIYGLCCLNPFKQMEPARGLPEPARVQDTVLLHE